MDISNAVALAARMVITRIEIDIEWQRRKSWIMSAEAMELSQACFIMAWGEDYYGALGFFCSCSGGLEFRRAKEHGVQ
jgi:hypothetical protein